MVESGGDSHAKGRQGCGVGGVKLEQLVDPRDGEDLHQFVAKSAEGERALDCLALLVQRQQDAEGLRREEPDVGKVQHDFLLVLLVDQLKQLLAQLIDPGGIQHGAVLYGHDGDAGIILDHGDWLRHSVNSQSMRMRVYPSRDCTYANRSRRMGTGGSLFLSIARAVGLAAGPFFLRRCLTDPATIDK